MGKHTPPMNYQKLEYYLKNHLNNGELQWLLRAATEWHVQNEIKLGIGGYHIEVYAMDSSFLHARTLFEFFTKKTSDNSYGCDEYKVAVIQSQLYTRDWAGTLHASLMHPQDRSNPQKLMSFDGSSKKDLNKMPVDFAKEIVRLWREFEKLLGSHSDPKINALQKVAKDILDDAIKNAAKVVISEMVVDHNVKPIDW